MWMWYMELIDLMPRRKSRSDRQFSRSNFTSRAMLMRVGGGPPFERRPPPPDLAPRFPDEEERHVFGELGDASTDCPRFQLPLRGGFAALPAFLEERRPPREEDPCRGRRSSEKRPAAARGFGPRRILREGGGCGFPEQVKSSSRSGTADESFFLLLFFPRMEKKKIPPR